MKSSTIVMKILARFFFVLDTILDYYVAGVDVKALALEALALETIRDPRPTPSNCTPRCSAFASSPTTDKGSLPLWLLRFRVPSSGFAFASGPGRWTNRYPGARLACTDTLNPGPSRPSLARLHRHT
jgi:hypothetical protein